MKESKTYYFNEKKPFNSESLTDFEKKLNQSENHLYVASFI